MSEHHFSTPRPVRLEVTIPAGGVEVATSTADEATVTLEDAGTVPAVLAAALRAGGDVLEMALHRPTLADAFLALTGRNLRDEERPGAA